MQYAQANRNRLMAGLFALSLVLVQTFCLYGAVASAQEVETPDQGFKLIVSPLPLALEAKPGERVSTDVKVMNGGTVSERVAISVMKFGAEGEDGSPKLLDPEPSDDFLSWISFSEKTFTAEPQQWKTIKVTIDTPKTAAFGYYYALVFARDNQKIEAQKANLLGAVAGLLLFDVNAPGAKRTADVLSFQSDKKVYEFLPANFTVRVKNTGNTHIAPRGNVFVKRGNDQLALLEVNKARGYILPGSVRAYSATWADGSPVFQVAEGTKERSLNWSNVSIGNFRMGKYTAEVVMAYNDGTRDIPVTGQVSFWVIPWRILAVLGVILLLVGAGIYALIIRPLLHRKAGK